MKSRFYEKKRDDLIQRSKKGDVFDRSKDIAEFSSDVKIDLSHFFKDDVVVIKTTSRRHTELGKNKAGHVYVDDEKNESYPVYISIFNIIAFIKKKITEDDKTLNDKTIKSAVYSAFRDADKTICKNTVSGGTGVNKYYCKCNDFRFRFANQVLLPSGQLFYPFDSYSKGESREIKDLYTRVNREVKDKDGKVHIIGKDEKLPDGWMELTSEEKKKIKKAREVNPESKGALCKHLLRICNIGNKENIFWVNKVVSAIYKLLKAEFIGKSKEEQVKLFDDKLGIEVDVSLIPELDALIKDGAEGETKSVVIELKPEMKNDAAPEARKNKPKIKKEEKPKDEDPEKKEEPAKEEPSNETPAKEETTDNQEPIIPDEEFDID